MKLESSARFAALTVGAAILLTACGGGGEVNLPTLSPSRTANVSPTATLPTVTEPTLTEPTVTLPTRTTTTAEPTSLPTVTTTPPAVIPTGPTQTSSPTEPTSTPTEPTPTPEETTSQASQTPSPTASETTTVAQPSGPSTTVAAESTAGESQGVPAWVWWLLAAIVIAVPVLHRRRRMDRWLEDLARARAEVAWLARELIPQIRQIGSHQLAAGGLEVSSTRIVAAEDQLTALIASAPDDVTLERSRILRDALRDARTRLDAVASSGTDEALAADLDEIAGELEAALATTGPTGTTGGAGPRPGSTPGPTDQSF